MPRCWIVPLVVALIVAVLPALTSGATGSDAGAAPPERGQQARYRATIDVTEHGIPHITAGDFGSLGFGSGYAAAESSICTLADTVITARGERSRYLGPEGRYDDQVTLDATNLQIDAFVTALRQRRVVERLLRDRVRGPGGQARALVKGYVAGANKWLRTNRVTDPACRGAAYLSTKVAALDLWYGVYLANLLASSGVFVGQIVDAAPPTLDDPGLPELPVRAEQVDREALLRALGRDPERAFGSNATAVGGAATSTRRGMLLGNPHFPWRGRYRFTQQHLTIPGMYDVAGASLIGSPAINIGWNEDVAWSHTVSTAYRFTPYEYKTVGPGTTYLTQGGPQQLIRDQVTVRVRTDDGLRSVTEDLYRTPQGYVIDAPAMLMPWSVASVWAIRDANAEHLRTIDTFLDMGKATSVRDLLRRQDAGGGIPWVNTTAADRRGDVLYADHSVVPNVPDSLVAQCLTPTGLLLQQVAGLPGLDGTFADGRCGWRTDEDAQRPGILGPANLPDAIRRDWVMNANDSYWLPNPKQPLEGYAGIIGCERCQRTMRTRMVSRYVLDRLESGRRETPRSLRAHQFANRVMAGEVMRADGALDTVCSLTGETEACQALAEWDGRSDAGSRGYALFEEFVTRLPSLPLDIGVDPVWLTPFDPDDPLNTPRGLNVANPQVIQAMSGAIDALREQGIAFDAPWGSLQVAGDRGARPLPLGGGNGDAAGNANALASVEPVANADRFRPVTYGSSHIQAVAFRSGGRVDARTLLTYGQSEDPGSAHSWDQTRLFSQERWVRFPWTDAQIRRDLVRRLTISGRALPVR